MRVIRDSEATAGAPDVPVAAEPAFIGLPPEPGADDPAESARQAARPWSLPAAGAPLSHPAESGESERAGDSADFVDPLGAFSSETEPVAASGARAPMFSWSRDRWLAVAATIIAIVEAGFLLRASGMLPAGGAEGRIRISSSIPGAEVLVDNTISGPAPLELPLRAGRHKVQVRYAGTTREFTADIRAGGESHHYVEFGPAPANASEVAATTGASGSIEITSDPAGARVAIDGRARGVTPLRVADLAPGDHDVVLATAAGSVTRRVRLAAGTPASLVVSMPKASAPSSGWVRIQSPVLAQVYESRELLGTTEVDRLMLAAGRHALRLVNTELQFEQVHDVEVVAGQTRVLNVTPPNGLLSVNAIPWAQVWIDGTARGETPIGNLALPIGTHEISFRHPQFGEQRRSVTVTLGGVTRVGVDLRR